MGFLKIAAADFGRRDLRGNGEHRHARAVAIEQAVDQVQIARSAAAGADRELAGQMRLGARREGRDFLVPDMHPFDLALAANRVGQPIQAVADDAVDPLDTCCGEDFRELISYRFCHDWAPSIRRRQETHHKVRTNGKLGPVNFRKMR